MTVASRETVRKAIAAGLAASGVLPTAKGNIYDYMHSSFAGASPVVRVLSGGSMRPRDTHHGKPSHAVTSPSSASSVSSAAACCAGVPRSK